MDSLERRYASPQDFLDDMRAHVLALRKILRGKPSGKDLEGNDLYRGYTRRQLEDIIGYNISSASNLLAEMKEK